MSTEQPDAGDVDWMATAETLQREADELRAKLTTSVEQYRAFRSHVHELVPAAQSRSDGEVMAWLRGRLATLRALNNEQTRLWRYLSSAREQLEREQDSYRYLADAVIKAFNPTDDDEAEPSLCARAVAAAGQYIEATPCLCLMTTDPTGDSAVEPCRRCKVLGRIADRVIAR
uniref:hypothetical protein n=1 Tax=Pseudonocardia sp. CA-138482 TaxID=3240023 RepID=UPI003F498F22